MSEHVLILSRHQGSGSLTVNQAREIYRQVAGLSMEQKQQMMDLYCLGKRNILQVFRTNCILVDESTCGLFLDISRVNHSCCPNSVDCKGMVKEVRAIKHITKGEEITMSYIANNWDIHANRVQELRYWQFKCSCQVCRLTGKGLQDNEKLRQNLVEKDSYVTRFLASVKTLQDNPNTMSEDDRRLLQCHIYVNLRQVARVAEEKLKLVNKMGHQMKLKLFSAHLHCLLLYLKARAVGVLLTDNITHEQALDHHGQQLDKMAGWSLDWTEQFCEVVGRGMLFSI